MSVQGSSVLTGSTPNTPAVTQLLNGPPKQFPDRSSKALTTASLIDELVQGSHYHDETLCQLLSAARNEELGDAAKRAVRHAARHRVMQLMSQNQASVSLFVADPRPVPSHILLAFSNLKVPVSQTVPEINLCLRCLFLRMYVQLLRQEVAPY